MDTASPIPPVLTVHEDYLLPVSGKGWDVCGELNLVAGCFDGCAFIDSTGREWIVKDSQIAGYKNPLHRLIPQKYREVRVTFDFEIGRQYSLDELKSIVGEFLLSKNLVGRPFSDKAIDVPKYLDKFTSIPQLIAEIGYFDARHQ